MNGDAKEEVKFLQIWVFPRERNVEPRYDEMNIAENAKPNDFQQIVSPDPDDDGVWIHQDAWFNLAQFDKGTKKDYSLKKEGNGVYVFVIEESAKIGDQILNKRDGFGIWDVNEFNLEALEDAEILLMEVPMELPVYA